MGRICSRIGELHVVRESTLNLAVARVVVCALVLLSDEVQHVSLWALRAQAMQAPVSGLGWLAPALLSALPHAQSVGLALQALLLLALVGIAPRITVAMAALLTTVVYALPHVSGIPRHSMHLVWFLWLLALSPCGDRLTVSRWVHIRFPLRTARTRHAGVLLRGTQPTWILAAMRGVLAAVYFFPGYWKLHTSGWSWVFSDNLQNQMYWKWYQFGVTPALRIDAHATLVQFGALAVLALELAFPLLMLTRATRLVAALGGLVFHFFADRFLFLPFSSLTWCYVILVDWAAIERWLRDLPGHAPRLKFGLMLSALWRVQRPSAALAACIVLGVYAQGMRGEMLSYPFACYPTFQWLTPSQMPDLLIHWQFAGASHPVVDSPRYGGTRSQAVWGMAWRAAGVYGSPTRPAQLKRYFNALPSSAKLGIPAGATLRFFRVVTDVRPDHWQSPPLSWQLLAELPVQ